MNTTTQFFINCIDLTKDADNSFYKQHIKLNLDNPDKTNYRIRNSGPVKYIYTHDKLLEYIETQQARI